MSHSGKVERDTFTWTGFAFKKPVTIWIVLILGLVVGIFATKRLPLELMPDYQGPYFRVYIPILDSSPPEVEQQITHPVEEELKTLKGLETIRTWSTKNSCFVFLQFRWDLNPKLAYLELRDRLERVRPELPEQVEDFYIWQYSNEDWPVIWMAFSGSFESSRLYSLARKNVEPALRRIDGVANVDIFGIRDERLLIEADMTAMSAHNIDIIQLIDAIQKNNLDMSLGSLDESEGKFLVRAIGHFSSPEEVSSLPIGRTGLRIKDVAHVELGLPPRDFINRIDDEEAITMEVYKESLANTVDVCRKVRKSLDRISGMQEMRDVKQSVFFDQSEWITDSLTSLWKTGQWGGLFAVLVLFMFLNRLRPTALIATAIPIAILATLAVMFFVNKTFNILSLNIISMMGMMLALGMLVDNSIVVMENIFRLRERGLDVKEASLRGATEVSRAVTASTLTTAIVFLPLIFIDEGESRVYMQEIGLVMVIALLASLWISLTFIPLTASTILHRAKPLKHHFISRMGKTYRKSLKFLLDRKFFAITAIILIFLTISYPSGRVARMDQSRPDSRQVRISLRMPENFSLEETDELLKKVEHILDKKRDELEIKSIYTFVSASKGNIHLFLREPERGSLNTGIISDKVREILPAIPGVSFFVDSQSVDSSEELTVSFYGDDTELIRKLAEAGAARLSLIDGINNVSLKDIDDTDEISMNINREQVTRYGLTAGIVSRAVAAAVSGIPLRRFRHGSEEISSFLRLRKEDRANIGTLENLPIKTIMGTTVPLGSLISWSFGTEPSQIERQDGKTVCILSLKIDDTDMTKLRDRIASTLDEMDYPPGYGWMNGERLKRMDEKNNTLGETMLLGAVLVFLLIGALFESWFQPFIIILTIPFALLGVFWFLFLTGTTMDPLATIGMVILIGIVVNNSIVLLDHINTLRRGGMNVREAVLTGSVDRMRPILMTAGTTILGMVPMAIGGGGIADSMYSPIGRVVIGGLSAATVGTLLVLPIVYEAFSEAGNWFRELGVALTYTRRTRERKKKLRKNHVIGGA